MQMLVFRLGATVRRIGRAVLRRRRFLAALCALIAVWAALRTTAAPPPPLVEVTVAAHDLGAGVTLAPGDVTTVGFTPESVPAGHLRDPVGRQLAGPVRRGEPVTDAALVGSSLAGDRTDLVAVPVRLPDPASASLLRVGDEIDVIAVDPQGGPARVVARRALVLAVPTNEVATDGMPGRVVVLGLTNDAVAEVASASVSRFLTVAWSR